MTGIRKASLVWYTQQIVQWQVDPSIQSERLGQQSYLQCLLKLQCANYHPLYHTCHKAAPPVVLQMSDEHKTGRYLPIDGSLVPYAEDASGTL